MQRDEICVNSTGNLSTITLGSAHPVFSGSECEEADVSNPIGTAQGIYVKCLLDPGAVSQSISQVVTQSNKCVVETSPR